MEKLLKGFKRLIASIMICFVLSYSTVGSCGIGALPVQASSLVGAFTAFELWQMLLLSLGVTCVVHEAVTQDDAVLELENNFDTWLDNKGYSNKDEVNTSLTASIAAARVTGTLKLSEFVWDALMGWTADVNGYLSSVSPPSDFSIDYNSLSDRSAVLAYMSSICGVEPGVITFKEGYTEFLTNAASVVVFYKYELNIKSRSYFFCYLKSGVSLRHVVDVDKDEYVLSDNGTIQFLKVQFHDSGDVTLASGGNGTLKSVNLIAVCNNFPFVSSYDDTLNDAIIDSSVITRNDYDYVQGLGVGTYDVVTPGRYWDEEDEKVHGDVVISLPADVPVQDVVSGVMDGTLDYADVLVDAGVYPVDEEEDKDLVFGGTIGTVIDKAGTGEDVEIGDGSAGTVTGTFVNILTGLFDKVLDGIDSIILTIQDMFYLDMAAIETAVSGFNNLWEEKLPFIVNLSPMLEELSFSENYDYPVIKMQTPQILNTFYKEEYIVLCDFEDYATYLLWCRNIVKALLWFSFFLSIFNHLKSDFSVS